jgi:hypothetical protein
MQPVSGYKSGGYRAHFTRDIAVPNESVLMVRSESNKFKYVLHAVDLDSPFELLERVEPERRLGAVHRERIAYRSSAKGNLNNRGSGTLDADDSTLCATGIRGRSFTGWFSPRAWLRAKPSEHEGETDKGNGDSSDRLHS